MTSQENRGFFTGDIETIWSRDSDSMVLTKDFSFNSPEKLNGEKGEFVWTAPKGCETDGASIPRIFWTFGHPFESPYRAAAVLHDYECRIKERPWSSVHKMFYLACICAGSADAQAKLMYWGVYNFGPKWGGYRPQGARDTWSAGPAPFDSNDAALGDLSSPVLPTTEEITQIRMQLEGRDVPIDEVPSLEP